MNIPLFLKCTFSTGRSFGARRPGFLMGEGSFFYELIALFPISILLVGFHLLTVHGLGKKLGLPYLFYHDNAVVAFVSGIASTLLVAHILYVIYALAKLRDSRRKEGGWIHDLEKCSEPYIRSIKRPNLTKTQEAYFDQGVESFIFFSRVFLVWMSIWILRVIVLLIVPDLKTLNTVEEGASYLQRHFFNQDVWYPLGFVTGSVLVFLILRFSGTIFRISRLDDANQGESDWRVWHEKALHLRAEYSLIIYLTVYFLVAILGTLGFHFSAICIMVWIGLVAAALGALFALIRKTRSRNFFGLNPPVVYVAIFFVFVAIPFLLPDRFYHKSLRQALVDKHGVTSVELPEKTARLDPAKPGVNLKRNLAPVDLGDRSGHPFIVVSAAGGGITAELFTLMVLEKLSTDPELKRHLDFEKSVRVVTGASGGMVGGAAWVANLHDRLKGSGQSFGELVNTCLKSDQLAPLAQHLALWDMGPGIIVGRLPFLSLNRDRGDVLIDTWKDLMPAEMTASLGDLEEAEASGLIPSLIIPTSIPELGRQMLVSNLDLSAMGRMARISNSRGEQLVFYQQATDMFNLGRHGPDSVVGSQPLAEWCRMTATFPLVTPAGLLPTKTLSSTVDAGFLDNQGSGVAVDFLKYQWLPWAMNDSAAPKNAILIEIQAYHELPLEVKKGKNYLEKLPFLEELGNVVEAAGQIKRSQAYANERRIHDFGQFVRQAAGPSGVTFHHFRFVSDGRASLSWRLNRKEKEELGDSVEKIDLAQLINHLNDPPDPSGATIFEWKYESREEIGVLETWKQGVLE